MNRLTSLGHVVLLSLLAQTAFSANEYYIEVPLKGPETLKVLTEQGFDVGGIDLERKTAVLVVPPSQLSRTRGLRILSKRPVPRPDTGYRTPEEVEQVLKQVAADYPHLVSLEVIGHSVEGRQIHAVHLTEKQIYPRLKKAAVLFDAMHHAREVMTTEVALDIIEYLTTRHASDAKVQEWLRKYSIWVVPMVNPDGNNKVWTSATMWRKNTRGGYGVDINRNYPYAWNTCNGSSGSIASETYRGPSPASEPETNALMDLATRLHPVFNISYHSFSEIVIYPFGCSPQKIPSPDKEIYEGVGRELASKLVRDSGSGSYRAGTSYELLYNVDGGSVDWMYTSDKIMSFVIEVNSSSQGFQPSFEKWRDTTVMRQRAGWQYILDRMDGPGIR